MGSILSPNLRPTVEYSRLVSKPEKEDETGLLRAPMFSEGELPKAGKNVNIKYTMEIFHRDVEKLPDNPFLGRRKHIKGEQFGEYEWLTYKQSNEIMQNIKYGIAKMEFCKDINVKEYNKIFRFMGITGINTYEYVLTEFACLDSAITIAAIIDPDTFDFIANQTEFTTLQCDSISLPKIIKLQTEKKFNTLKNIIVVPHYTENKEKIEENIKKLKDLGINVIYHSELVEIGKKFRAENEGKIKFNVPDEDTVNSLVYTSGSTGTPKGVMIDNRSRIANTAWFDLIDRKMGPDDSSALLYLPLGHNYGQWMLVDAILHGTKVGLSSGNPRRINEDCRYMNPIVLAGVPRSFDKIIQEVEENVKKLSPFWQKLYEITVKTKLNNYEKYNNQYHWFLDKLMLKKVNNVVGNNIQVLGSSSAPNQKDIIKKIKCIMSAKLTDGYGATEASGILCSNYANYREEFTGGPFGALEIKLVSAPELNYTVNDKNPKTGLLEPRGELYVRGPDVTPGYFKEIEKTKELFDADGFYHTGDIAVIMNGPNYINALKIIDRRTNFFKLSQGEFIIPDKIQPVLKKSKFVEIAVVVGVSNQAYLVGIIVPKKDAVVNFLKENGVPNANLDNAVNYYEDKKLLDAIIKDCDKVGREGGLKGYELIKKCYLSKIPFTEENGLLTNLEKVKYKEVKKKFANEIDNMYKS